MKNIRLMQCLFLFGVMLELLSFWTSINPYWGCESGMCVYLDVSKASCRWFNYASFDFWFLTIFHLLLFSPWFIHLNRTFKNTSHTISFPKWFHALRWCAGACILMSFCIVTFYNIIGVSQYAVTYLNKDIAMANCLNLAILFCVANILIYTIAVGVKKIVNKLCATPLPTMPDDKCQNPIMGSTIFTISSFIVILAILLFLHALLSSCNNILCNGLDWFDFKLGFCFEYMEWQQLTMHIIILVLLFAPWFYHHYLNIRFRRIHSSCQYPTAFIVMLFVSSVLISFTFLLLIMSINYLSYTKCSPILTLYADIYYNTIKLHAIILLVYIINAFRSKKSV